MLRNINLPIMNQEEIGNLNRLLTIHKIELVNKKSQQTKIHDHMASLVMFKLNVCLN